MIDVASIANYEAFSDEVFSQDANVSPCFETLITRREIARFDTLSVG